MMKLFTVVVLLVLISGLSAGGNNKSPDRNRSPSRDHRSRSPSRDHSRDKGTTRTGESTTRSRDKDSPSHDTRSPHCKRKHPCMDACPKKEILVCELDEDTGDYSPICVTKAEAFTDHFNHCDILGGTAGLDCECNEVPTPQATDPATPVPTDAPTPVPTDAPTPEPTDPEPVCGECDESTSANCPVSLCAFAPTGVECTGDPFSFTCHCWLSPAGEEGYCAPNFDCDLITPDLFGCANNSECDSGICVSSCCGDNHCMPSAIVDCCDRCEPDLLLEAPNLPALLDNDDCNGSAACY